MDKPTNCSIDGCMHRALARGLCNGHYKRQAETGTTFRPCPGCGNDLPVRKGIRYCSPECQPICEAPGCERPAKAGDSCHAHATRKARTGSYERLCETCGIDIPIDSFAKRFCSTACSARKCSVDGCEKPAADVGMCRSHGARRRSNGSPHRECQTCGKSLSIRLGQTVYCSKACHPKCEAHGCSRERYRAGLCDAHYALSRPGTPPYIGSLKPRNWVDGCGVCGAGRQEGSGFCSPACYQHFLRHGEGAADHQRECASCGETFSLLDGPGNKRRPPHTRQCLACKCRKNNYRKRIPELIDRDGAVCAICDGRIDEALRFPHPSSLSVDHIIPWSAGGGDDASNLQLAHLQCNSTKQDRVGFKIA